MNLFRLPTRLVALAFAIAVVASCDNRVTAPPCTGTDCSTDQTKADGTDVVPPKVTVLLAAAPRDTFYLGSPLAVNTTATDDKGIVQVVSTVTNNGLTTTVDTIATPATLSLPRTFTLSSITLAKGDQLTIKTTATDLGATPVSATTVAVVADTATPRVTISSNVITAKSGTVNGADSIDVQIQAADSAGIATTGYRLRYVKSATDTVLVLTTPVTPPTKSLIYKTSLFFFISDTLPITGQYVLEGLATDRSGLSVVTPGRIVFTLHDAKPPTVDVLNPLVNGHVAAGDSILVRVHMADNSGVASVTMDGYTLRGDPNLGTQVTLQRYPLVRAPATGSFPVVRDTIITRYMRVALPVDSTNDTLNVHVVATDNAGNVTTKIVKVTVTNGPRVTIIKPTIPDSLTASNPSTMLRITVNATSTAGVNEIGFDLTDSGWPTSIAGHYSTPVVPSSGDYTWTKDIAIPSNAPPKGLLTITPMATDVNGQPGSGQSFTIAVRQGAPPAPIVTQQIPPRAEVSDTLVVTASGTSLTKVGYVIETLAGVRVDSNAVPASASSFGPQGIGFKLAPTWQGTKMRVYTFATDASGLTGYSVPSGVTLPQSNLAGAVRDTMLIVYGQTFTLPSNRSGTIADVVVDQARGNIFLSNIGQGRLEVWKNASKTFDATGIVVGSQPWGMTMSRTAPLADTLYVANSGGTNLSRVYVGPAAPMKEDAGNRMLTRMSLLYKVTETRDPTTGRISHTVAGPFMFSDRPQYVEQSISGRLYISTKPTPSAPAGTIRAVDPASGPAPDERFLLNFATVNPASNATLVANIDGASRSDGGTANDPLTLCDHATGTTDSPTCVTTQGGLAATLAALRAAVPATDVDYLYGGDEGSLGLTDTTFVASSVDGKLLAFGEGHRSPTARAILLHDDGVNPPSVSASISVADLINNASDQVFGLALDKTGQTLAVHGTETYFTKVTYPFEERLQGKKTTFATGSGIAFHPNADGPATPQDQRLAFVASANGTIEVVDIAYYDYTRGTLSTKFNLYGPLRVSLPFAGDPPSVILKLFGLSQKGLVVIDVTAADILPGP
jgi:hypothetical protein